MHQRSFRLSAISLGVALAVAGCEQQTGSTGPTSDVALSLALATAQAGPRVFVVFDGEADPALVEQLGGNVVYSYNLVPAVAATAPGAVISQLAAHPRVVRVEPDGEVRINDAELDNTWGVEHIGAGFVHDGGNKGAGVKIAVIDSGCDYTHLDGAVNYVGGWDFVNNDDDPMDDNGHGTHVSGTVAAADDGVGVVGVAPAASLYCLKVLNANGSGAWSDIIAALDWAAENEIQVTNNSYGRGTNAGGTVQAAFANAAAGIVHVASAGNSGNPRGKGNNVGYPARFDAVIAVAATRTNDTRASFSSTGDQVELAAPGVAVNSTKLGGGYVEYNGTSMASPHVAGTAALIIAAGITDANGNGNINDEIRQRLGDTAEDLGDPGRDPQYGFGLVDADEAADLGPPNDAPDLSIDSPADGSSFGTEEATILFEGTASDTEDGLLTSSLVWTSDIDDQIGTGGSFSTTLSDGNHTITATVTDSGSKTGSASISITVGTPPPPPLTTTLLNVSVSTNESYVNKETVQIIVPVTDGTNPVSGAAVHMELTTANGRTLAGDATTDENGQATLTYKVNSNRDGVGTYTVYATASKAGFESGSGSRTFEVTP